MLDLLIPARPRRRAAIFLTALMLLSPAIPGFASQQRPAPEPERRVETAVTQAPMVSDQDAADTREKFEGVLKRLPTSVVNVLRLDPSLMSNESYLAPYPGLAAFLKQHPEIRTAPGYYLGNLRADFGYRVDAPQSAAVGMWQDVLQFLAVFMVFSGIALFLIWTVKNVVEYRRWNRIWKVHTDVNNKLMDRFSNNEDLLAYIQTPAGRKFVEAAPLPVEASRPVGAPLSRILWSVQIGLVLAAGALGLLYISNQVVAEVSQPLFAIGVVALMVGVGFIVSAGASYVLSRQLGLLQPSTLDAARQAAPND
jgi:hypothetical protein